jgi:two-component system, chemotaxis family, CheB/CheR fusion protein
MMSRFASGQREVASGEEAYSISILLAEHLGIEAFKQRVKIYGTDVDEDALNRARTARYSAKEVENIPSHLREKYFEPVNAEFRLP